jgi:hypothetical protein
MSQSQSATNLGLFFPPLCYPVLCITRLTPFYISRSVFCTLTIANLSFASLVSGIPMFVDSVLGWGGTTIPKNEIFWEPWLFSAARLRSVTLSHKGYRLCGNPAAAAYKAPGFAGPRSALRPAGNSFCDWVYASNGGIFLPTTRATSRKIV